MIKKIIIIETNFSNSLIAEILGLKVMNSLVPHCRNYSENYLFINFDEDYNYRGILYQNYLKEIFIMGIPYQE